MAKKDESLIWLLLGVGVFFVFSKRTATVRAGPGTIEMTSPTVPLPRPIETPRAPTTTVTSTDSSFVKWYQESLNYLIGANLTIDGIAGPLTKAAVQKFQVMWGVEPSGIVDDATEYYMKSALGMPGFTERAYEY